MNIPIERIIGKMNFQLKQTLTVCFKYEVYFATLARLVKSHVRHAIEAYSLLNALLIV